MIQIGQTVKFKFGKQPVSPEHKALAMRRASNMIEHAKIQEAIKSIIWEDLYSIGVVTKVDIDFVWIGDSLEGYRVKISDVIVLN